MVKAKYNFSEIKKAVVSLKLMLEQSGVRVADLFLYGSYAHGKAKNYSDIDIAVISPNFRGKNRFAIQETIAKVIAGRTGILSAIEPIGYSTDEFSAADNTSFLAEIKRTGKRITPQS